MVVGVTSGSDRPADLEQTFLELYNQEAMPVLRYLHAAVRDYGAAEELMSETFLRAWQAWPRFEHRGVAPRSWLFRIARNLAIDHARKRRPVVPLADAVPDQRSASPATVAFSRLIRCTTVVVGVPPTVSSSPALSSECLAPTGSSS